MAVSPNGDLIASASEDRTVILSDVNGDHVLTYRGTEIWIDCTVDVKDKSHSKSCLFKQIYLLCVQENG